MNINTLVIIIIIIIVILTGGWLLSSDKNGASQVLSENSTENITSATLPADNLEEEQEILSETTPLVPQSKETVIAYTNGGFVPGAVEVGIGETVTFVNESDRGMWVASNVHPTHTIYPIMGGCIGSSFDACKSLKAGERWSFTFDIAGSWRYHNHVSAARGGAIIVK